MQTEDLIFLNKFSLGDDPGATASKNVDVAVKKSRSLKGETVYRQMINGRNIEQAFLAVDAWKDLVELASVINISSSSSLPRAHDLESFRIAAFVFSLEGSRRDGALRAVIKEIRDFPQPSARRHLLLVALAGAWAENGD